MQSQCNNRICKTQLSTLSHLLEEQRRQHLIEVKKIEESLEQFSLAKNQQCEEYRAVLQKMASKVEKYKSKCCTLNDKIKQQLQTIKSLNNRIANLEDSLKNSREEFHREKGVTFEHVRLGSQLRQIIALQEGENKELALRVKVYQQQLDNLREELNLKALQESKLKNIDFVSEEQYQRQASLLRENLKLEFTRSTEQLLSTLPISGFDFQKDMNEKENKMSRSEEQLRILSNFTEYGSSFLILNSQSDLVSPQSKKIFSYFKSLAEKNEIFQQQIEQLTEIRDQLKQNMKNKLSQIEQLVSIQQKPVFHMSTQTPNGDALEQLASMNAFYRIKNIQLHNLLGMLNFFACYLFQLNLYKERKIHYFKKGTYEKLRKAYSKRNSKFKTAALAIFFIEYSRKKARKTSKSQKSEFVKDDLERMISISLKNREKYSRKNPVLQKLLRDKAKVTTEGLISKFQNMVKEQNIGIALNKDNNLWNDDFNINFL